MPTTTTTTTIGNGGDDDSNHRRRRSIQKKRKHKEDHADADADSSGNNNNTSMMICPYLDTIQRSVLDFDLEHVCSVSLSTDNIYCCLVCGIYLKGRGKQTPAFTHAVSNGHYMFLHLQNNTIHCLPDDYQVTDDDPSLLDIHRNLQPTFTSEEIEQLDRNNDTTSTVIARDLFGRVYIPGFVGMNNLHKTDGINCIIQAFAHIVPLRNYFLSRQEEQSSTTMKHHTKQASRQTTCALGAVIRKLWSSHNFKSHVDPHQLVHLILSNYGRTKVGQQIELGDFLSWFLHQLHLGTATKKNSKKGKKKKTKSSSFVEELFQGKVRVTTRRQQAKKKNMSGSTIGEGRGEEEEEEDDRAGSDAEQEGDVVMIDNNKDEQQPQEDASVEIEETTILETNFFQLTLDIAEKPVFRDQDGGLVIPQEPLVDVLDQKFGRHDDRFVDSVVSSNGVAVKKKYEILQLPKYLILHLSRFTKNEEYNTMEKNPTIVLFPVKNLDLTPYVVIDVDDVPSHETIQKMSIKELKATLRRYGCGDDEADRAVEKQDLIDKTVRVVNDQKMYKYDLVANLTHESAVEVGREGTLFNPLQEGSYKCHVQNRGDGKWYEMQDLHVQNVMPQQIGVSESVILIFERQKQQ